MTASRFRLRPHHLGAGRRELAAAGAGTHRLAARHGLVVAGARAAPRQPRGVQRDSARSRARLGGPGRGLCGVHADGGLGAGFVRGEGAAGARARDATLGPRPLEVCQRAGRRVEAGVVVLHEGGVDGDGHVDVDGFLTAAGGLGFGYGGYHRRAGVYGETLIVLDG